MPRRTFTMLSCRDDLDALRSACPTALDGDVMAFDPDSHGRLLQLGLPHLTPWSVVARDEWPAVHDFEAATVAWWRRAAHALYRGFDLLGLAQHRHTDCLARLAWAAYVIRRAFEDLHPARVVVFEEPDGHGLEQPPAHRQMPLLHALLRGMAEQAGIETQVIGAAIARRGFVDAVAQAGQRDLPRVSSASFPPNGQYLLFHANDSDLTRQLPLLAALMAQGDLPVVQLYKTANERSVAAARTIGHHVWHESQVLDPAPATNVNDHMAAAGRDFEAARRTAPSELAALFRNPRLDIHFDFIFGAYLHKMARHVDAWTTFFQHHRPAAIVVNYAAPIYDIAVGLGIPGLFLPHGTIPRDMRWYLSVPPSVVGAVSPAHRRQLLAAGRPAAQVETVGDPSIDPLLGRAHSSLSEASMVRRALCARFGLRPQKKLIVLVTSDLGTPSKRACHPYLDWANAVSQIEKLGQLAAQHPGWSFLLRGHPRYDHPQLYEPFVRRGPAGGGFVRIDHSPPEEFCPAADAIVVVNAVTSALVEFSLFGKPVLLLMPSAIWHDPDEWLIGAWPHLASVAELEHALERMFCDSDSYQARVAQTAAAVERFFDGPPTPAVPRCIATLRRLTAAAPPASVRRPRSSLCRT